MLGACSGSGGGEPEAPPPISLQQYETTLAGAVDSLQEALKGLAAAKAYKGLEGRVKAVEDAGDQAVTELTDITPPVKLAPQHAQLVTALEAFHEELGGLTSQVDERALCTGSAVRTGLRSGVTHPPSPGRRRGTNAGRPPRTARSSAEASWTGRVN